MSAKSGDVMESGLGGDDICISRHDLYGDSLSSSL
jgi:hypothetical protein